MEGKVGAILSGEFLNAVDCDGGGVVEIVDHHDVVTAQEELKHRVASYVTGAPRHQYLLPHLPIRVNVCTYTHTQRERE